MDLRARRAFDGADETARQDDLARLMWLIDEGGKALETSAYPLAQAFLIHTIERVMDELLADPSDNDIEVLEKAIELAKRNN